MRDHEKPVSRTRTQPARAKPADQVHQPKPVKRCSLCNDAGFLELRQAGTNQLIVHRCPHKRELVARIEKHLPGRHLI